MFGFKPGKLFKYDKSLNEHVLSDDISVDESVRYLRKAADCHNTVREEVSNIIKPNMKLLDISNFIETKVRNILGDDLKGGMGFPVGISLNNTAAHDGPMPNDERVITKNDIAKIDFGTHVNGYIIDSAFTIAFDSKYDDIIKCAQDAMWAGIKELGPDSYLKDVSRVIKETIESYDFTTTSGLGGHNLKQYKVHGGKLILGAPIEDYNIRASANEIFAVELFPTTGTGNIKLASVETCTHFMLKDNYHKQNLDKKWSKDVLNWILNNRLTLPFSNRWITHIRGYNLGLKELINKNIITAYPAIYDIRNSYSAQFEKTLYLHDFGKEVF